VDEKNVVIEDSKNRYGTHRTTCKAFVYQNHDDLVKTEMKYYTPKASSMEPRKSDTRKERKAKRKARYRLFGGERRRALRNARKNK
jgi:small subunit ribosomal protein S24e